jgi:hypothetical protein
MTDIPDYIEARIRQRPPAAAPVVPGSTPVVAFGDVRKSKVATLGWNPSKLEFLDRDGNELVGDERRLETLASIGENDLVAASADAVRRIFQTCNNYFHRNPYHWFNKLEKILKHVGVSYYDGSACHLDLVQWATDPVWGDLPPSDQIRLIDADLPFLDHQLSQENFRLLLLNGRGIMKAYEERLGGVLMESPLLDGGRLKLFTGRDARGLKVVGWNINLQSNFGVWNKEIEAIGAAVKLAAQEA